MQTPISYPQLEVTVLSRDLRALASSYCDKESTNSNLVLCVFRPPAQPKWITQNQGHIVWARFGSSLRFTKGVYRKLICQLNNIKVYFGLQDISPGSITIEDKLLWQPQARLVCRFVAGICEAIFYSFLQGFFFSQSRSETCHRRTQPVGSQIWHWKTPQVVKISRKRSKKDYNGLIF